jgi:ketosteroid isomerase-like protein
MRALMIVVCAMATLSCRSAPQDSGARDRAAQDSAAQDAAPDVVAMEKAALDRWGKGDPQGYLEIMANEVTYFDPTQEKRVDGGEAMRKLLAPITGKVKVSRFDMIDPKVQHHGDAALLTFNLVSYVTPSDGKERAVARWNSSELYARVDGQWRIVHSHWSYIKPELKQAVSETQ